jgi:hypothetical protein
MLQPEPLRPEIVQRETTGSGTTRAARSRQGPWRASRSAVLPALAAMLLLGGAASADTVWYGELYTSTLLGDVHGSATLPVAPLDLVAFATSSELGVTGSGLGSGLVSVGSPLTMSFTFAPQGFTLDSVLSATAFVSVVDDLAPISTDFLEPETGQISVAGSVLDGGSATLNLFAGSVTAWVQSIGDALQLTVSATSGDFRVALGGLAVKFEGTPIAGSAPPSAPEPGAALVFCAALLLVGRSTRGWRPSGT